MNNGWIKLHRKLLENPLWCAEEFTKGQAWIDLLMLANFTDSKIIVRGVFLEIKRGQVGWSEVKLCERWMWSRGKVNRFLDVLEKEQQIIQQKNNLCSIITILNYDNYQLCDTANRTTKGQQTGQQTDSKQDSKQDTIKEFKKDKNEKKEEKVSNDTKKKDKPSGLLPVYFQFMILGLTPDKAILKAEKFYSHYQSNGWKVSKNPMKDWKAATSGTWCDFTKAVGYQKDHLCYIVEELEKQYGDRAEHDQFDFVKLKHDRPELFDREMYNNDWNKYLEGLND